MTKDGVQFSEELSLKAGDALTVARIHKGGKR